MVKNLPTVERSTKIRFGKHALENQAENTVVFNASDAPLQATTPGAVYLSPIRFRSDFSSSDIVLLMYDKSTGEITESGSSASTAVEPPLQNVTSFGNTTNQIIQFTNPTTAFTTSGNVHVNGDLEVQGNINFHNGTITEIKNTDLVVEDRIIGVAHNNTQVGLDTGIIINYPNQNVGIIHHGDETPKRLSIGYTQNGSTDTSITADANNITLDVLGDCTVQNDLTVNGAFAVNSVSVTSLTATGTVSGGTVSATTVSGTTGTFTGTVSGTTGTFTGAVSGASITDGTATLTGGALSGSAATLTTARTIGGVSFDGSANIDLPGVNTVGTVDTSGSAATLTTARTIGGVAFNGSANIDLPGVNTVGTVDTSGSAATLTTARLIGGVSFNGSANIDLPGVNTVGTENTTGSAATLTTSRTIGGVAFNGSADIVPTTFNNISAADGTFTGAVTGASYSGGSVSGTFGTFSGNLSGQALTVTSAQVNGAINTTGNFAVNTDAIFVDATNKRVGINKSSAAANLDIAGNIYATGDLEIASSGMITGDGGGLSNINASHVSGLVALSTGTSGDYVESITGGDGISVTGGTGEGSTPSVVADLKTNGGLVIESAKLAMDLAASSITGTLAVANGGTGVTTSTGSGDVVLSASPTLTGTLTAGIGSFSGAVSGTTGTFSSDLAVNTNAILVDATNKRVGIGKTPTVALDVVGGVSATGALTVTDGTPASSNTAGAVVVSGGIAALGDIHSGDINASAGLDHASTLGTAKIGYDGATTGDATFAQTSNMSSTAYALKQTSAGATSVNAATGQGITLKVNNATMAQVATNGDFSVDTDTLYVDAGDDRVGINKNNPTQALDVVGSVAVSQNITTGVNLTVGGTTTATNGMIINTATDGVTKKFYSFKGTLADQTSVADASLKLTFSSNIFYAKIVAHLVEDSTEFSNMSLEVGGGSRAGGATPDLKLGAVSIFGNTSTNPWDSSPDVSTTAGAIILKPSSVINNGNSGADPAKPEALYNIFVEYISPDGTNGKLETIHVGSSGTAVKTFTY